MKLQAKVAIALGALAATAIGIAPGAAMAASPTVYATDDALTASGVYQLGANEVGLLAPLTPPLVAAGNLPVLVGVAPDGDSAYVANRGGGGTVSQYDVRNDGTLAPKAPPSVPAPGSAQTVAFTPDSATVYIGNYSATAGAVQQFSAAADGTLTPKVPPSLPLGPESYGIAVSPNGKNLYAAAKNAIHQFDIGSDGALTPKVPPTVATTVANPRAVALTPEGASLYVTDFSSPTGKVSQFDVGAGGALTPKDPPSVSIVGAAFDIAVAPDGAHAYVTAPNQDAVFQFEVARGGKLAPLDPSLIETGTSPWRLAIAPNGIDVYSANGNGSVGQFEIEADGGLSQRTPATVAAGEELIGIAVGGDWQPRPPEPPSNEFTLGPLKRNKRKGTGKLTVTVPGPGEVSLARTAKVKGATARAGGAGSVRLAIVPRGKVKRKLRLRGKARLRAAVTFAPDGGTPATQAKRLRLRRKR